MNHQPDHDQPRFGDFGAKPTAAPETSTRLSLLALFSIITGLLSLVACCVPVVGLVPIALGTGALFGIQRSRGRVAGRGLAFTGLFTGVLAMIVSTGLWLGASSVGGRIGPVYSQAFDPDPAVVRTILTSSAAAEVTDERIAEFQVALAAEHPGKVEIPKGLFPLWMSFGKAGGDPAAYQKLRSPEEGLVFPFPAEADGQWFYAICLMSPAEKLGSGLLGLADVGFEAADGSIVWLVGEPTPPAPDSQSPPAPGADESPSAPPTDSGRPDPDG